VSVEVFEKFESRRSTKANQASQSSAELGYIVRGTDNDIAARDAAQANSPATYDTLPRQSIQIEPIGPQLWDVAVCYGSSDRGVGGNPTYADLSTGNPPVCEDWQESPKCTTLVAFVLLR